MDGESQKQKTSNLKVVFALSAARFVPFALLIDIHLMVYTQFSHRLILLNNNCTVEIRF